MNTRDDYDGIINKPEMEDLFIEHGWLQNAAKKAHKYIDKYMKNGKWIYRYKSKAEELSAKARRKKAGITDPSEISYTHKDGSISNVLRGRYDKGTGPSKNLRTTYDRNWTWTFNKGHDQPGIKAGRKRTTAQRFSAVKGAKNKKGKNLSQRGYSRSNQYGRKDGVSALSDVQGATAMYLNGNGGKVRKRSFDEGYRKTDVSAANYLNEKAKKTKADKNSTYNKLMEETTRNGRAAIRARKNRKSK